MKSKLYIFTEGNYISIILYFIKNSFLSDYVRSYLIIWKSLLKSPFPYVFTIWENLSMSLFWCLWSPGSHLQYFWISLISVSRYAHNTSCTPDSIMLWFWSSAWENPNLFSLFTSPCCSSTCLRAHFYQWTYWMSITLLIWQHSPNRASYSW